MYTRNNRKLGKEKTCINDTKAQPIQKKESKELVHGRSYEKGIQEKLNFNHININKKTVFGRKKRQ